MGKIKEVKLTRKELREKADRMNELREARNARRREKYASDAEYRKRIYEANRERYRKENNVEIREAVPLKEVESYATRRTLDNGKKAYCLDYSEMSKALGNYHAFVLHRWHRADKFPRGKHVAVENGRNKSVYLLPEAKKLINVFRAHQKEKAYFTGNDQEVINKLFSV